jgi:hypothetical protein
MKLMTPYSIILCGREGTDLIWGEICQRGPFASYEEAISNIRLLNGKDFVLDEQYVYILTPDHKLISIDSETLEVSEEECD